MQPCRSSSEMRPARALPIWLHLRCSAHSAPSRVQSSLSFRLLPGCSRCRTAAGRAQPSAPHLVTAGAPVGPPKQAAGFFSCASRAAARSSARRSRLSRLARACAEQPAQIKERRSLPGRTIPARPLKKGRTRPRARSHARMGSSLRCLKGRGAQLCSPTRSRGLWAAGAVVGRAACIARACGARRAQR